MGVLPGVSVGRCARLLRAPGFLFQVRCRTNSASGLSTSIPNAVQTPFENTLFKMKMTTTHELTVLMGQG